MKEEKTLEEFTADSTNLSSEKLSKVVKQAHNESKDYNEDEGSKIEIQEKIYNLGFMPVGEINGLVLNELGESFNLDRVKKLWLPKSQKANQLIVSDMQLLDDEKMKTVVKDIDPKYSDKIAEIEKHLQSNPFWQANKHSIKLVRIDELIALQNSVNTNRANNLAKKISKDTSVEELLDYNFDFSRKPSIINSQLTSQNVMVFSTTDHDVRHGKIEVRKIPMWDGNGTDSPMVSALVIPIVEGEPSVYCLRTYAPMQMPDGSVKNIYFMTLMNGIHRAYAYKSRGIEYMPCLIIDPTSASETDMLMGNWSQERKIQNASQRPPLMKDFFNPELTEKFKVRKKLMCIRVEFKIEGFTA